MEIFFSCPSTFFGSTSTIGRFGERFRDGQYSLVSFLFAVLLLSVPRAQPSVKVVRGHVLPCHMESAPLVTWLAAWLGSWSLAGGLSVTSGYRQSACARSLVDR